MTFKLKHKVPSMLLLSVLNTNYQLLNCHYFIYVEVLFWIFFFWKNYKTYEKLVKYSNNRRLLPHCCRCVFNVLLSVSFETYVVQKITFVFFYENLPRVSSNKTLCT